jgi:hypothetical protein
VVYFSKFEMDHFSMFVHTAERRQELGPAGTAAHAGEAVLEQAAVEQAADRATRY